MRGWRGPRVWRAKRAEWSGGVGRRRSLLAAKPPAVVYQGPVIFKTTTLRSWPAFPPVLPRRFPPSVLAWTSTASTKPYSVCSSPALRLVDRPFSARTSNPVRPRFSVPPPLTLHSTPHPLPSLSWFFLFPRNLAPGPATHLWFFSLVPSARPLSPVVGGEGSGRWHVVPRVRHASWMAGPGREFRGVTRFALPPTLPLALSPILPPWQGTLGGRFHLALFRKLPVGPHGPTHTFSNGASATPARVDRGSEADAHFFASWSARTNSHFFEGKCRLIAADLRARPRSTHGFSCVGPHGPR